MRVDHRRRDILVTEQLLDGANVAAALEQVGGERVAEGVAGRALGDSGSEHGPPDGLLEHGLVQVVAAALPRLGVQVEPGCGEDLLPGPVPPRIRELVAERVGELDPAGAGSEIAPVLLPRTLDVGAEVGPDRRRQHTVTWLRPKSTSLTRSRQHSSRHRPEP